MNDVLIGCFLLLLAAGAALEAQGFPPMPGQRFGPALFPTLIAGGLAGCGLLLVAKGLHAAGGGWIALGPAHVAGARLDALLVLGGLALLILLWDRLGFLIAATLYAGALIARFRRGQVAGSFALALLACFVIDWSFRRFLLVPLPLGPLTGVLW